MTLHRQATKVRAMRSVPSIPLHRMAGATKDWSAVDAYARDAIDAYEYLGARAVPERPVVTLAAKLVVWLIAAVCGIYCIAIWMGIAS